jgi:pimeloyl-ACP methyl ester carboxylesterase
MRNFFSVLSCILICLPVTMAVASPFTIQSDKKIEGSWLGTLEVPGGKLRVVANVTRKPDGTLTALMDSPDQGAKGIPISRIALKGSAFTLEVASVGASFEGKLSADGKEIVGIFKQGGGEFPLTLKRVDKAPEVAPAPKLNRPQEPKPPFPYKEREVAYENTAGGVKLAGTLTVPQGKGPFPAVLLITGSGVQNRNEELMGHKPFLLIADYLTRRGIAVLRVDDRGIGGSTGSGDQSTTNDFVGDVLTGVAFLKKQPEIDPKKIGLIGHSEGGLIAPIAASRSTDVAFIVMMAGTGLPGEEILYLQGALIAKAAGAPEAAIAEQRKGQEQVFAILKQEKDNAAAEKKLIALRDEAIARLPEDQRKQAAATDAQFKAGIHTTMSPWFRYFLTLDPRPSLRKVTCPVLAINGENDLQVPPKANLPEIEAALKAGGNKDYTVKELPGLNHLFQESATGSPSEYAKIEETISPFALQVMGDWIVKHTQP